MFEVKEVSKAFPGVKALDNVSMRFELGEVHGLMGENGAGKSTLMKIMTGIYKPDQGSMSIDGKPVAIKNFKDSSNYEISMVHQEIQVIPESTVAENIVLDKIEKFQTKLGKVDWNRINKTAQKYLDIVELDVKPTDVIKTMTAAQKQLVQIAKALSSNARYILMDEPTSSLTAVEAQNLFKIIRKLKNDNCCIIFVSHKIEEVMEICDRVSVLRDGRNVGTRDCASITRQELIKMMINREENVTHMGFLDIGDEVVLEARNICKAGQFQNESLVLRKGEILGLYGLIGAGRTEFARLIVGADKMDSGQILLRGKPVRIRSMQEALRKYKIGYVSENRREEGLILQFSLQDNINLTILEDLTNKLGKISDKKSDALVSDMVRRLEIKAPGLGTPAESLSGGNQQKVSIGKWLAAGCDILIIDEPTVGVDVGAKRHIHEIIWHMAKDEGKSIILISSDMPEMITLARRILVFKHFHIEGEITGLNDTVPDYDTISEKIGNLMS